MTRRAPPTNPSRAATEAAEALRLVQTAPAKAAKLAGNVIDQSGAAGDPAATSTAQRALGLALKELGDVNAADLHLRAAVRTARRWGLAKPEAEARMSRSMILAYMGRPRAALREADFAAEVLRGGVDAARLLVQRGLALQLLGRYDEALDSYRRALLIFRRTFDPLWEARCLNNRGVLRAYRGNLTGAEADLRRAEELYRMLGQDLAVADVLWNRGFVAMRGGDVPGALALFDLAEEAHERQGVARSHLLIDRCEVLLSVRLVAEARAEAERAVNLLAMLRRPLDLAEARLVLSHAALLDGDAEAACDAARRARRAFARQGRPVWQALAEYALLRANRTRGSLKGAELHRARRTAEALEAAGWVVAAADARILAARIALELGRAAEATAELAYATRGRRSGPVDLRARAWHAEGLLRLARMDRRGAQSALRTGLGIIDKHRASLGATELRAHVSSHGEELASLGLKVALESGRPEQILTWAELWRASTLRLRPVRPPDDAELARKLAELRQIVAEISEAVLAGRDTTSLLRRQAALEITIRKRSRRTSGASPGDDDPLVEPEVLAATLGERALVEIIELKGELHAVVVTGISMWVRRLGPFHEVEAELESLLFSLRRLALQAGSPASWATASDSVSFAAKRLNDLLFQPVAPFVEERPLVLVPTGPLHAMPWSILPDCAGRPVVVAPSATTWYRAERSARPHAEDARVVLVAGPGLPGALTELRRLRRGYPKASAFGPSAARVEQVLASMDGADLAHVAAHGHFRADNPLFSSLQLADGPMTVYDLERLRRAPRRFVLSACESGLSGVRPGDELMGLSSALFSLGTSTLVASVVHVPDAATASLMIHLHRGLREGKRPAEALASAQRRLRSDDPAATAASAAFVCFGSG